MAKNPPADAGDIKDEGVIPGEDPLEEGTGTQSRILAWSIPWTEEPGGCSLWGHRECDMSEHRQTLSSHKYLEVIYSIFRLFMMPVSSVLFPFKSVWSVSETVWTDPHLSSHLGTIQKSFPSVSEYRFGRALFLSPIFFFLIYSQGQGGFTSSQYNLI